MNDDEITTESVRRLAAFAALPLPEARLAPLADLLRQWIPAANALSSRMQADDLRSSMPAVVFTQGESGTGAEADR
ncbi:hypothetical protein [Pseudonocardia sp.]|uniref:hypothetical protein n=1 Tax=Pseudonocardia sp. TaxID=60912 RepID=UPI003D096DC1